MFRRTMLALILFLLVGMGGRPARAYVGNVAPLIPYDSGWFSNYSIASDFTSIYANDQRFMYRQLVNFLNQHLLHSTHWFHLTFERVEYDSAGHTLGAGIYYKGNPWEGGPRPLVIYAHGSEFNRNKVPSTYPTSPDDEEGGSGETPALLYYAMKLNAAVLAVDYPGMGPDRTMDHPYCQYEPLSKALLDAIPVGIEKMQKYHLAWDGRVLVTGYSEGGYAVAAALRKYHEDPTYITKLPHKIAFAPGAGPYDMSGTMVESMFSDDNQHPNPWYMAYLVKGWNNPTLTMNYVFQPWLWGTELAGAEVGDSWYEYGFDTAYNTDVDVWPLNWTLMNRPVRYTGSYSTARLLTGRVGQEQYHASSWPNTELGRVLRQNDIHAGSWWISSPTYLFGNVDDDNVPYGNHTAFLNHMAFRTASPGILTEQTNDILTLPELDLILGTIAFMGGHWNDRFLHSPHELGGLIGHVQTADWFASITDWNTRWPSAIDFPKNNVDKLGLQNQVTIRYRAPFHGPQVWIGASYDGVTNWRTLYQGPNKGSFTFVPRNLELTTPGRLVIAVKDLDADNQEHDWNRNRVMYSNTELVDSQLRLTEPAAGALLSTDPWCTLPMTWTGYGPIPLRAEARLVGISTWTVVGRFQGNWSTGARNLFPSIATPGDYDVRLVEDDASGNASAPVRVRVVKAIGISVPAQFLLTSSSYTPFVGELPSRICVKIIDNANGSARTIYDGPQIPGINLTPLQLGLADGGSYVVKLYDKATGYGLGHSNTFRVYAKVKIISPTTGSTWSRYAPLPVTWSGSGTFNISRSRDGINWTLVGTSSTGSSVINPFTFGIGKLYIKVVDPSDSSNTDTVWVNY